MIAEGKVQELLSEFDLGASTAENDPLLEVAKIETQQFIDLYVHDRIDIIKGIKGAGKTALYRLFFFLDDFLRKEHNLFCIFGVEPKGDPIFRIYQNEFKGFNEVEFENFWNVFFIALVYNFIHTTPKLKEQFKDDDLITLDSIITATGLKITKKGFELKDSIPSIQKIIRESKVKFGLEAKLMPNTGQIVGLAPIVEIEPKYLQEINSKPLYVAGFREQLANILKDNKIKIWIMIDRLDEVFPHRSDIEKIGLRSLLRAAYNFSNPNMRTKIFLRDDIIGYLAADGFTALTHITDRCSSTMSWSKDELMHLITKRISALSTFVEHYKIDLKRVDANKEYREDLFYNIFPPRIGNTQTMDWIFMNCADANDIVTPRDMIDFFKEAKAEQFKMYKLNPQEQEYLLTPDILRKALEKLSIHKKDKILFAEFQHLKHIFLMFEGGYSEYDKESIAKILGSDYLKQIDELKSIGFIKHIPKSASYKIPPIWHKGLNIRRGKGLARIKK